MFVVWPSLSQRGSIFPDKAEGWSELRGETCNAPSSARHLRFEMQGLLIWTEFPDSVTNRPRKSFVIIGSERRNYRLRKSEPRSTTWWVRSNLWRHICLRANSQMKTIICFRPKYAIDWSVLEEKFRTCLVGGKCSIICSTSSLGRVYKYINLFLRRLPILFFSRNTSLPLNTQQFWNSVTYWHRGYMIREAQHNLGEWTRGMRTDINWFKTMSGILLAHSTK